MTKAGSHPRLHAPAPPPYTPPAASHLHGLPAQDRGAPGPPRERSGSKIARGSRCNFPGLSDETQVLGGDKQQCSQGAEAVTSRVPARALWHVHTAATCEVGGGGA